VSSYYYNIVKRKNIIIHMIYFYKVGALIKIQLNNHKYMDIAKNVILSLKSISSTRARALIVNYYIEKKYIY